MTETFSHTMRRETDGRTSFALLAKQLALLSQLICRLKEGVWNYKKLPLNGVKEYSARPMSTIISIDFIGCKDSHELNTHENIKTLLHLPLHTHTHTKLHFTIETATSLQQPYNKRLTKKESSQRGPEDTGNSHLKKETFLIYRSHPKLSILH